MTQKKQIVAIGWNSGPGSEKATPASLTNGRCHPITSGQGENLTTISCGCCHEVPFCGSATAEVFFTPSMNEPVENQPEPRPTIEPAQMQFIEANFNDFLGSRPTDTESMKAWRQ